MSVLKRVFENVRQKTSFTPSHPPRSPVPHLLSSNATPTDDERKLILGAIEDAETQLGHLPTQQPDAKRQVYLREFITIHRLLLVRIRSLPPELLQEIFLLYSETSTGYHRWVRPPFILGQICRSWRQAAISLPGLWDKLPAFKLHSAKTRTRQYCSVLEELLRRSGTAQTLRVYIRAPFQEIKLAHPVVTILARHANRIQSLTLESGVATAKLFQAMKGGLSSLEQLELAFWTKLSFEQDEERGWVESFESAPMLKKLTIMAKCPPRVSIPLENIEEYKERYDGGMVGKVLERSKATLKTLEIVKNAHHAVPMIPPTTLEVLQTLRVRLDDSSDVSSRFFLNLTLPAIETVQVVYGGNATTTLSSMFSQSPHRTLRKLAFRGSAVHFQSELKTLFSSIPQLTELDLEVTDGDYSFLQLFADVTSRPLVLPLLEKLSLYTITTAGMEDAFNAIANSRCERLESDMMPSSLVDPTKMDFDLVQEVRPLKTLRINLPSREVRLVSQAALNGWKAPTRTRQFRDTAKLQMWRKEIINSFPSYFSDPEPGLGVGDPKMMKDLKKGKIPKLPERWRGILTEVSIVDPNNLDQVSLRVRFAFHSCSYQAEIASRHPIYTIPYWISHVPLFDTPWIKPIFSWLNVHS